MLSVISSGQIAKQNLSTQNLVRKAHQSSNDSIRNSVGGVIAGSNPIETSNFLKGKTLQSNIRVKSNLSKSVQNAVSFVQSQESKMQMLDKIYCRMTELASHASDPFLDDQLRIHYASEFQVLKKESINIGKETFQGKALFDETAPNIFLLLIMERDLGAMIMAN